MSDDEHSYRRNLFALNGLDVEGRPLDVLSKAPRKGPHRLGRILDCDELAIRITNRRARAGLKPKGITR